MRRALALTALLAGSSAFAAAFQCGDQRISVDQEGDNLRLTIGAETFVLWPVATASGAKYEAPGDAATSFWSKGSKGLLELRGQTFPECVPLGAGSFRATGNEPFWSLDITEETLTLVTQLGASRLVAATPQPERGDGVTRYAVDAGGQALTVTLLDQRCADTMTGMPHPSTVIVAVDGEELRGCGGDPASLLHGAEWAVEAIDGEPPVEGSKVSIAFDDTGRVSGAASCNRFTGGYALSGEGLRVTPMATTRMACPQPLMTQEQRFLALLEEVIRFDIADDGGLLLVTGDGRSVKARRP